MNPAVDDYIASSRRWPEEVAELRSLLIQAGLAEEIKWRKPCYTHDGENIVIIQEMKDFLALMFFKGALLEDPAQVLRDQGPNSRSARRIEFTSIDDVRRHSATILAYIAQAVEVADAGLEVEPPPELELVDELQIRIDADPSLKAAFEALTPGRQREYNLYVSGAKQAKTRTARADKYVAKILAGKGLRDR